MYLKQLEIGGFKSFAKKAIFHFDAPVSAIVGPNGSGKSNIAEAIRFVLGEQSMKTLRGKRGEDLIWNGSHSVPRSNRASVSIFFDNTDKSFDIDYDEVVVKREVYRDGTNGYFINNSLVRLKDILELLAKVHIGASGHHIISQGEADRILNANIKDRRTMIEETLGLKIYQWKMEESRKKLKSTEENLKQVQSLRREIAPHIKFLRKQVEKVERAREMREELKGYYAEYLKREDIYLEHASKTVCAEREAPDREHGMITKELADIEVTLKHADGGDARNEELLGLEREMSVARKRQDDMSRQLGRIEGMIEYEEDRVKRRANRHESVLIPMGDVEAFTEKLSEGVAEGMQSGSLEKTRAIFERMREYITAFLNQFRGQTEESVENTAEHEKLIAQKKEYEGSLAEAIKKSDDLVSAYEILKWEIEKTKDTSHDAERRMFELLARKSEVLAQLSALSLREEQIHRDRNAFKEELREGGALIGREILNYESHEIDQRDAVHEDRERQEKRRRDIEKIKIKLEDAGASAGEDVVREFEEVSERDRFLEREIADLEKSAESLERLISELTLKLDRDFKEGIKKINAQFQEFFSLMFGGGTAALLVVTQKKRKRSDAASVLLEGGMDIPEEEEEGIDVDISLPRKKIKGLQMLSGGERALTSIALIFAVSQVNPPPFLVLDETEAALDEANSRKYGDMLENLSKRSQLIVVTHNRETMSRADVLYGVTMGSDAVSKLLSVKFGEAASYAK